MTIDQVKVIEIGADAIEAVLNDSPILGLAYPPKLMHAVVAALGRHGYIIEDRYEDNGAYARDTVPALSTLVELRPDWGVGDTSMLSPVDLTERLQTLGKTTADWEVEGDDA